MFLQKKSQFIQKVRDFFHKNDFVEVFSPILTSAPAMEDYIDAVPAKENTFLRTSPELNLKRVLAKGYDKIFEIGPCFRLGESGRFHLEEFLMLEWYRSNADYMNILDDTQNLLRHITTELQLPSPLKFSDREINLFADWEILNVDETFQKHTGISVKKALSDGIYEELLDSKIEQHLGSPVPTILKDYPPEQAAFAVTKNNNPTIAERWELYLGGLEIANCYTELTDPQIQRKRFADSAKLRKKEGRPIYPLDKKFLAAIDKGIPSSGGIALGLDRLCMILFDIDDISKVAYF
ncbi:MAG: amino acid--tRNA ligase-related protein [Verrucomicrobiota bacterium]|nr:amino acid--tRNA ligase-related protein [Verrucomicrobiota bacterium]